MAMISEPKAIEPQWYQRPHVIALHIETLLFLLSGSGEKYHIAAKDATMKLYRAIRKLITQSMKKRYPIA